MDEGKTAPSNHAEPSRSREQLEAKYIELLEKRIAVLEALELQRTPSPIQTTTTTEENIEKFRNGVGHHKEHQDSVVSPAGAIPPSPKIRFRESKFNNEGVETVKDVADQSQPSYMESDKESENQKDSCELIWLRVFDDKDKYHHSEVEIESVELRALLRLELAHDPWFHTPSESIKNSITLTSPFVPLIHNWARLEELANPDNESSVFKSFQRRISEIRPSTAKIESPGHTPAILTLADEKKGKKALTDLTLLLQQVRTTPELKTYFPALEAQRQSQSIQFDYLWTIFPPGELVYNTLWMKKDQIFIVKESGADIDTESDSGKDRDTKKFWSLVCWSYDWDGKVFNRVPVAFKFEDFQGSRVINTLGCHPLKYHSDLDQLRSNLVERGKKYRELCIKPSGSQMFEYGADAISHGAGFQLLKEKQEDDGEASFLATILLADGVVSLGQLDKTKKERSSVSGRIMVDFGSYLEHAPNIRRYGPMGDASFSDRDDECHCVSCINNQSLKDNQKTDYDNYNGTKKFMDDTQYLICPPRVLGYHLDSRTWLELESEKIEYIARLKSEKTFSKLELAKPHKDLIRELVQSHTSGTRKEPMMEDIMKEKGKGLVILLHGPPGVGKTLTAESVAELTGKPLFSVSPSDIGLNPAEVEQNLEVLFELAARWRAVLLFDEADVFLESRSSHSSDLTRNALVSVLLRVLEYYDGILILTTNRIQQFDIAVQSRVNLGIKYKDLSMIQKKKIFTNFLEQIPEDKIGDKDDLERWLDGDDEANEWFDALNGRQVRNVLFSAASLALMDGGMLKVKHIKKMAKSTYQFQDSIKSIVQEARRKAEVGRE